MSCSDVFQESSHAFSELGSGSNSRNSPLNCGKCQSTSRRIFVEELLVNCGCWILKSENRTSQAAVLAAPPATDAAGGSRISTHPAPPRGSAREPGSGPNHIQSRLNRRDTQGESNNKPVGNTWCREEVPHMSPRSSPASVSK